MDDTNVKLSIDVSNKIVQQLSRLTNKAAITVDIGPNLIQALRYLTGTILLIKSIDLITTLSSRRGMIASRHHCCQSNSEEEQCRCNSINEAKKNKYTE